VFCRRSWTKIYVTSSLTRGWVCLLWIGFTFLLSVSIARIACSWKFFHVHYIQVFCQSKLCKADHVCLILCYNGSLVAWMVVSLTIAKCKHLVFLMSGFALSYTGNMFILMILYDFCLLLAQFCYVIIYIWSLKVVCKSWTSVHLGKFLIVQRSFSGAAILIGRCVPLIPRRPASVSHYRSNQCGGLGVSLMLVCKCSLVSRE
jgi:hypothetical protein